MRVLHTIGEMGTGGAESLVAELVRRGADRGWHSEVASAGGHREDELSTGLGVRAHRVPLSRRRAPGVARAFLATRRALRAARPDVVVAHNVGVSVVTRLAVGSLGRRVPIVTVFHGVAAQDYRAAARLLSWAPDRVVTVSAAIASRLVTTGLSGREVAVIPNAVSPVALPDRAGARAALGLDPAAPVALCVARLVEQKRHDVLLRAWAATPPDAVLLLAGDGPLRPSVEALRDRLGLADRVRVLGARRDVPDLLAAADLFTLSSDWEGLPLALLEAMSAGLATVATGVDGVSEALRHGGGVLVPPGDPVALGEALVRELSDPVTLRDHGREAVAVIRAHYDPETMVDRYDALLRSLVPGTEARVRSPRADDETTGPR